MDPAVNTAPQCMWRPNPSKRTNVDKFRERINKHFNINLDDYKALYKWSVENYPDFWEQLWHFSGVKYSQTYTEVIDKTKTVADIPQWFKGSRLNYAENILKYNDDRLAVCVTREGLKKIEKKTYSELYQVVAQYAAALRKLGIKQGDRVVGYIPNGLEALAAMLAASSIGAIWSSTSPEFGVTGVLDRFTQIQPKVIFSVNAVIYNGKIHHHLEKLEQIVERLPDLEKVVVVPYILEDDAPQDISRIRHSCFLAEFLNNGKNADGTAPELVFEQLPFDHPLFIMYSSGTTGAPKCMVHSQGGTLIKHLEEHLLQGNMCRDDIMMYYTTTGWMMWNWLAGCLLLGSAILCYDGSPLVPNAEVLWDLVDEAGVTVLGTGAKWLAVLEEKGVKPAQTHTLSSLKAILSTGSPLKPQSYEYVYRDIKSDILLGSITGGTDILGCFAGHSWDLPVYKGQIQGRLLGIAMECWNEDGKPVFGVSGELVCVKPFPSQPTQFWNDPDGSKYKKAYFDKFPDIWAHGDFCQIDPTTGGVWMLGRSDGTLNPNGVRFGSAEIYHIVEAFKELEDSLCVSQRSKDLTEERVILFLKMAPGSEFSQDLVKRVKTNIRNQLSARHVPGIILETHDIPYTHSGKKIEVAVKRVLAGEDVKARGAFANPNSLNYYYDVPELQGF
ncbi:hypothetical protein LSH36_1150g00018 [Paralvinella palmiformis]|uniref:Acetoacetyl-CoA synthetase n=1 Tax=Paralvinella palmiformis TaxID=53620 RepID=A0AAD9IVM5_9ANNE|nr:hypothetical protein LSH36_1150g00018 [Paralvinella palmiformis]